MTPLRISHSYGDHALSGYSLEENNLRVAAGSRCDSGTELGGLNSMTDVTTRAFRPSKLIMIARVSWRHPVAQQRPLHLAMIAE